jgi:hypothetical protein
MRPSYPQSTRPRRRSALLGLAAAFALLGADGPASVPSDPVLTALKTDGSIVKGRLRQLGVKTGVSLAIDDHDKIETIPAAMLVKLERDGSTPPTTNEGAIILFPDGDRLNRSVIGPAGETTLEVQSFGLGTLAIPLDSLLALVLAPPVEGDAVHALVGKIREDTRVSEVLWLANGDRLAGGLLGLDDKKVAFQLPTGKVELDRSGVIALGFDPKLVTYPRPTAPYLELTLIDGSRLGVTDVHVEGGQLQAVARFGQPVKIPLGELAQVHAKNGSVVYLSERSPTLTRYVSYLGPTRPVRTDQAIDGQPLRLGGKIYDRGLGTQSRTYLAYRLEPGVKRLQALVGVDDRAGPLGSVVFRVVVDGAERFASPPMSVRDTPRAVDVDVTGAKSLVLITDFGERGEVRDHADWAEVRLIR